MPDLMIEWRSELEHEILCPVGSLRHDTAHLLRQAIIKGLLDMGRVVVSLGEVQVDHPSRVFVFATALDRAGGWPQARLALCGGPTSVVDALHRLGVTRAVPHAATVDGAVRLLDERPPMVRRAVVLRSSPEAPGVARVMLTAACSLWEVPEPTVVSARLVLTELVTNAVQHARSSCHVLIEFTGVDVRMSVRDRSPEQPTPQRPDLYAEHGRGLLLVAALATRWGVVQRDGWKEIWAVVDLPS